MQSDQVCLHKYAKSCLHLQKKTHTHEPCNSFINIFAFVVIIWLKTKKIACIARLAYNMWKNCELHIVWKSLDIMRYSHSAIYLLFFIIQIRNVNNSSFYAHTQASKHTHTHSYLAIKNYHQQNAQINSIFRKTKLFKFVCE